MSKHFKRVVLIVLDSVGMGAAPDAADFGDAGANTLGHISRWCEKNFPSYRLPNLTAWGLGKLLPGAYGLQADAVKGSYASLIEKSPGKDTTTGHWELAGTFLEKRFPAYPQGFPQELLERWAKENNLPGWLCNHVGSGTQVIDQYGEEHLRTGKPIVYTSADSVWQIAASEETFGIDRLRAICSSARKYADELNLGRVIARPFTGKPGTFKRTGNRKDYSQPPPAPNLLDAVVASGGFVAGVGKIDDIFAHRSISQDVNRHTSDNATSYPAILELVEGTRGRKGLIFINLIDFDQNFGHRRDPGGYARCLMDFDDFLPKLEAALGPDDLALITADHGNDPTFSGTDHTRESVPFLAWSPRSGFKSTSMGQPEGFVACARLCTEALGLELSSVRDAAKAAPLLPILLGSPLT
jgi:phosphopentomutase